MGMLQNRAWRDGKLIASDFSASEMEAYLRDPGVLTWVDLCDPSPELLNDLANKYGLDPHSVEDATGPFERPKAKRYPTYMFITCYATFVEEAADGEPVLITPQVSAFVFHTPL